MTAPEREGRRKMLAQAARSSALQVYRDQLAHQQGVNEMEILKISQRYQRELARIKKRFGE